MKKGFLTIVCLLAIAISVVPASAQTRSRRFDVRRNEQRIAATRYRNDVYTGRRYNGRYWEERSFWDRHRDKLTTAIGAGAGAAVGAAIGGKKGAIIGAIAGGGGAAIYTYGIRDDDDNNWRRQRRRY
ncbi:MAG TPA: hypothetical protein VFM63_05170 [Pyrinomonadaceae bacterium]|nr:hypothetical protein [Pyrinomonadaceae bacterium]